MLKKIVSFILLLVGGTLFADAISIGYSRDGYPLVVPQVKKLKTASGSFTLPIRLTVTAPETLDLAPLVDVYAQTVSGGSVERDENNALCRFELVKAGVPKSPEGYTLAVKGTGIVVRARDVRGLYYGMQTLNMMLRHRGAAAYLKNCTISDWPDLKMRGVYYQLRNIAPGDVDRVCHVIDVFGSLKYNTLLISFADNFPYADSPFTGRKTTLSRSDVERILAAARRNHMEVIPFLQLVSHSTWMDTHRDWARLREGKSKTFCLSNPELQPLIEKVVRETADIVKPRYFHIGLDEIEQCGFPKCPECSAADTERLLLKHLLPIKKLLAERGITPIICQDQFFGFGEPKYVKGIGIEKFPEKFGTDTMIETWEYADHPSPMIARRIKERGFKKFHYMSFGVFFDNAQNTPRLARKVGAEGVILAYWGMLPATMDKIWGGCLTLYPSFIAQANYSWNTEDCDFAKIPVDGSLLFQELLDGTPDRSFRGTASQVPLGGAFNRRFSNDPVFPSFDAATAEKMRRIAAADTANFELQIQNGAPLAVVLSGSREDGFDKGSVTIPIDTAASGASFLVTAAYFNNFALSRSQHAVVKTIPLGQFEVIYRDGAKTTIPLTMRLNINDWNTYFGGALCRAVVRGNDRNGALFSLYAIDWRNPHPDKEIKEIVFSSNGDTGISPALFAVSLSNAAKTPVGAIGTPPTRFNPVRRPVAKLTAAVDFSAPDRPKMEGYTTKIRGFFFDIVYDTKHGRVLEIRIPESLKFLARAAINISSPPPPVDFESVVFDIRVSGVDAIYRPDFFMLRGGTDVGALAFAGELGDRWITVCLPKARMFTPNKKLKPEMINTLSLRFFMQDNGVPCTIRVGNIHYCDRVLPCRSNITTRVK